MTEPYLRKLLQPSLMVAEFASQLNRAIVSHTDDDSEDGAGLSPVEIADITDIAQHIMKYTTAVMHGINELNVNRYNTVAIMKAIEDRGTILGKSKKEIQHLKCLNCPYHLECSEMLGDEYDFS